MSLLWPIYFLISIAVFIFLLEAIKQTKIKDELMYDGEEMSLVASGLIMSLLWPVFIIMMLFSLRND